MGNYILIKVNSIMKTPTFNTSQFDEIYQTDSDGESVFLDQLKTKIDKIYKKIDIWSKWTLKWSSTILYQFSTHLIFIGLPFLITLGLQQLDGMKWEDTLRIARQQMEKETMKQMNNI